MPKPEGPQFQPPFQLVGRMVPQFEDERTDDEKIADEMKLVELQDNSARMSEIFDKREEEYNRRLIQDGETSAKAWLKIQKG